MKSRKTDVDDQENAKEMSKLSRELCMLWFLCHFIALCNDSLFLAHAKSQLKKAQKDLKEERAKHSRLSRSYSDQDVPIWLPQSHRFECVPCLRESMSWRGETNSWSEEIALSRWLRCQLLLRLMSMVSLSLSHRCQNRFFVVMYRNSVFVYRTSVLFVFHAGRVPKILSLSCTSISFFLLRSEVFPRFHVFLFLISSRFIHQLVFLFSHRSVAFNWFCSRLVLLDDRRKSFPLSYLCVLLEISSILLPDPSSLLVSDTRDFDIFAIFSHFFSLLALEFQFYRVPRFVLFIERSKVFSKVFLFLISSRLPSSCFQFIEFSIYRSVSLSFFIERPQ